MYQGIYYSRQPGPDQWSYFVRDSKKGINQFTYWPTVYKIDDEGEFETLFGDRCTAIKGKYDRKDPKILEKDIDKELVVLRDLYYKTNDIPDYHNILHLDIEIEIIGALNPTTIKEANAEITSIALIDMNTKQKICLVLDKESKLEHIDKDGVLIIPCKSERELLLKFLNEWEKADPTIVVGWNSDYFDIPYLYYRIKKKLGDDVYRLSPIGKITETPDTPESPIRIGLVSCLDYMLLLKKYIAKEEPSYKLGDIGEKYVKLGKLEYDGSLDKLFADDIEKFIAYNIRDVEILEELEKKLKFIELTILISHICHTPYESIYYNTALNEGAILTYLKRKNVIAPNKPTTTNPSIREINLEDHIVHQRGTPSIEGFVREIKDWQVTIQTVSGQYLYRSIKTIKKKDSYAGGYLLEPIPGLHSWMSDYDYSSYYPSCIMSLNIGIETLVGWVVSPNLTRELWNGLIELEEMNPDDILTIGRLDLSTYQIVEKSIKVSKVLNSIKKNNWNVTANGVIYRTDKTSIASDILSDWFDMRKKLKDEMKVAYGNNDMELYDYLDIKQLVFKVLLNAMYGGFAVNSFRFTDGFKLISSSITCTCQRLIQETIKYANEMIEEEYLGK